MNRRGLPLILGSILLPTLLASPPAGRAQARLVLLTSELCSDRSEEAVVTFEDANLEAAVRAALSAGPQDDLTCGLVSEVTELEARDARIGSLAGIPESHGPGEPRPPGQLDRRHRPACRAHESEELQPR